MKRLVKFIDSLILGQEPFAPHTIFCPCPRCIKTEEKYIKELQKALK